MPDKTLLYLEDDETLARVTSRGLDTRGFSVTHCQTLDEARALLTALNPCYALLDLKLENETSLSLVKTLLRQNPKMRVVVLTGFGSIATAVQAMKLGAVDFLSKPASIEEIVTALVNESESPALDVLNEQALESPSLKRLEWETIQQALRQNDGNITATAKQLKMHRRTLQRKLQKRPSQT